MKKRLLSLLMAAILVLVLVPGCSSSNAAASEPSGSSSASSGAAQTDTAASGIPYTAEKPLIWKLNSNQTELEIKNCAQGRAYLHLAEELEKRTNGAWKVEMYYSSQLGSKTADLINGAQFGTFQLFNLVCSSWGEYTNAFLPINVPYLTTDEDVIIEFLRGEQGRAMSDKLREDTGIRIAFYCPLGWRPVYNSVRPINTPDDFKGIKMRALPDKYVVGAYEAFGATCISMPYAELYTGLQQGLADGADNPYVNIYNAKHYEVTKFLSDIKNTYCVTNLCVADNAYQELPAEWKAIFDKVCAESFEIASKNSTDPASLAAVEFLKKNMTYNKLEDEQLVPFIEKTAGLREMAKEELGAEAWNAVVSEIERIKAKLGK